MVADWLDGSVRLPSNNNGGSMLGGPPRFVHHTYEAPYSLDAAAGAKALIRAGNEVHFVFHPLTGHIIQLLPASVAGRGLENRPGGVQTNRMGSVCLQVEVIARAARPWTLDLTPEGMAGLAHLIAFARAHGIPDTWPAGPPPAYPPGNGVRSVTTWTTRAGHYGHSQVPENDHGDPGALDIRALFATAPPQPPPPAPTTLEDDVMLFRARTASKDGSVPVGSIMSCAVERRWHIPGTGSPLVSAYIAAGGKIVEVDGQDIVDAFPVDAAVPVTPPSAVVDVAALAPAVADEILAKLPADLAAQVAADLAARLAH